MPDLNLPAVLVAAVVVFVIGLAYYAAVGERLAEGRREGRRFSRRARR